MSSSTAKTQAEGGVPIEGVIVFGLWTTCWQSAHLGQNDDVFGPSSTTEPNIVSDESA